jgi:hypothetical protein
MYSKRRLQIRTTGLTTAYRYDRYGERTYRKSAKPKRVRTFSSKRPVLIVQRELDHQGNYAGTKIVVKSPVLIELLQKLNKNVEGLELSRDEPSVHFDTLSRCHTQLTTAVG